MTMSDGYHLIDGVLCRFHSRYKNAKIYRQVDVSRGYPQDKMSYCATVPNGYVILHAKNLDGIKKKVSSYMEKGVIE